MKSWYHTMGAVTIACALAGTAFAQQNSGFLGSAYSKLIEVQSPSGHKVRRWIAPMVTLESFQQVMLEKTVFHPQPRSSEQISLATLNQISSYLDEALRRELAGVVKLATEPGPKTLRFRPAITAAAVKDMGLKPYQYLPVAFILTAGKTSKDALLAVEYELQDTDTNEVVGAGMRESTGVQVRSTTEKLTLNHFKPIIDGWAKDMRAFVEAAKLAK